MKTLFLAIAALFIVSCRDHRVIQPTLALPRPGTALPGFDFATQDGGQLQASTLVGKPTLLFLWSTHCPTSRGALAAYRAIRRDYVARGVRVVMLSDDESDAEMALLPKVLADSGVGGELALARGQLATVFDHSASAPERDTARVEFVLPSYLLIGSDGHVVARSWGPDPVVIRLAIDSLLAARPVS